MNRDKQLWINTRK